MNERIKELIKQSYVWVKFPESFWGYRSDDEPSGFLDFDKEKFAELIVRECIDCAVTVGHADNRPIEPVYTIHEIKRQIKKYFGVEE